jgi:hypothetical protein
VIASVSAGAHTRSDPTHAPESYQRVIIELRDEGVRTNVSVTERNDLNQRELERSEGSWRMVLHGMKALLEGTSVVPMRGEEMK